MKQAMNWALLAVFTGMSWSAEVVFDDASGDRLMGLWSAPGKQVQVIGLGSGVYRVQVFTDLDHRVPPVAILDGSTAKDGSVTFAPAKEGTTPSDHTKQKPAWWPVPVGSTAWKATWKNETFTLNQADGTLVTLTPAPLASPTLGLVPPVDAVVLLNATSTAETVARDWVTVKGGKPCPWTLLPGGILQGVPKSGTIISRRTFASHRIHLEFRLPYEPARRGQERANSGLYLQGRYEIQILDSFGLQGADNECGGIYKIAVPQVNRCAPPGTWQTYDVEFTAAEFASNAQSTSARVSVRHNGGVIHVDQPISAPTGSATVPAGAGPGGVCLQDHDHPVQFRNVWVVPTATP